MALACTAAPRPATAPHHRRWHGHRGWRCPAPAHPTPAEERKGWGQSTAVAGAASQPLSLELRTSQPSFAPSLPRSSPAPPQQPGPPQLPHSIPSGTLNMHRRRHHHPQPRRLRPRTRREAGVEWRSREAASSISTAKVDSPRKMRSWAPAARAGSCEWRAGASRVGGWAGGGCGAPGREVAAARRTLCYHPPRDWH